MLTFIIPLLLGTILGFLIRGKPSDTFAITKGRRVAWGIGIALGGVAIGTPVGLSISSTTGPQIAGLIGAGLGFGVFNILSIENTTYKKWSDKNGLAWLIGGVAVTSAASLAWFNANRNVSYEKDQQTQETFDPDKYLWEKSSVVPQTYLGVSLGDSEQQVRYVLGEPQKKTTQENGVLLFAYGDEHSGVWLSPITKRVQQVGCQIVDTCPPFLGLKIGDDESKVKTILGGQAIERFQEGGANDPSIIKIITLSKGNEISFYLERKKVIAIMLRERKAPEP